MSKNLANKIRRHVLRMTHKAKASHIGSCLSIADILAVLYSGILRDGDKFILSKGHACAALYAVLAECGFFPLEKLDDFYKDVLSGHASHYVLGVDVSTGSLGQGLSIGCGMALVIKQKVYVLLGDGDCDEGSTWEAVMFAAQYKLSNLIAIVDYNKMQALGTTTEILDLASLKDKCLAFNWAVQEIDGHNLEQIRLALNSVVMGKSNCIIAHTVKGKGVSFMENCVEWHYKYPNDEELELALKELE